MFHFRIDVLISISYDSRRIARTRTTHLYHRYTRFRIDDVA